MAELEQVKYAMRWDDDVLEIRQIDETIVVKVEGLLSSCMVDDLNKLSDNWFVAARPNKVMAIHIK